MTQDQKIKFSLHLQHLYACGMYSGEKYRPPNVRDILTHLSQPPDVLDFSERSENILDAYDNIVRKGIKI